MEKTIEEQVKEWKKLHGFVYKITLSNKTYYFRTLTRDDYVDILGAQATVDDPKKFDHDLEVTKKCLLSEWTEEELTKKAGISTILTERIMIASGFETSSVEEL